MPLFPRRTVLAHSLALAATLTAFNSFAAPVQGGELVYLEQQAHTNLYPPAGGFYPNGGILNQITDKLTWQNPSIWWIPFALMLATPRGALRMPHTVLCESGSISTIITCTVLPWISWPR